MTTEGPQARVTLIAFLLISFYFGHIHSYKLFFSDISNRNPDICNHAVVLQITFNTVVETVSTDAKRGPIFRPTGRRISVSKFGLLREPRTALVIESQEGPI
ncbi:MAG: hypothetical protein ABSG22_10745 [Sedimentisphaerales bacterium]|jgi:hypothetical protein